MKQLIIHINKQIGETGQLRDEATLDHIVEHSNNIARDIAVMHPFVDGNKRTAYIVLRVFGLYSSLENYDNNREHVNDLIQWEIEDEKDWLDILKEC